MDTPVGMHLRSISGGFHYISSVKSEYFETRFKIEKPPLPWPRQFGIVTACNPLGQKLTNEENVLRDHALQRRLQDLNLEHWRIYGGSARFDHLEPGFGIASSLPTILKLGQEFEQDAIFWIENESLYLISSDGTERFLVEEWQRRVVQMTIA